MQINPMALMKVMTGMVTSGDMSPLLPMADEAMPASVRMLVIQKIAADLTIAAAILSSACGKAIGAGVSNRSDVHPTHVAEVQALIERCADLAGSLPVSHDVISAEHLVAVYTVQPAPEGAPEGAR